jgi:hypothetical protein
MHIFYGSMNLAVIPATPANTVLIASAQVIAADSSKNHLHDCGIAEIIHLSAKLTAQPPIRMFNARD